MDGVQILGLTLLIVAVLLIAFVAVRRYLLARSGAIDMCWRDRLGADGSGWYLGVGKFKDSDLALYRSFSLLPTPNRTLNRAVLSLGARRAPAGAEQELLPVDAVITRCHVGERPFELAMSNDAATGLQAWVEAVPPSNHSTGRLRRRKVG